MDSNGDGAVSADEHAAGAKTMFDRMDANKDGVVTAQEMEKAHPQGDKKMSASDKIKTIDTNGDGQLSAAEHAAGSAAMFDKMDTDHNGSLSAGEWKAGHAPLMEKKSQ
jgi:Ca2+-binding EF-hand superfamily protein